MVPAYKAKEGHGALCGSPIEAAFCSAHALHGNILNSIKYVTFTHRPSGDANNSS